MQTITSTKPELKNYLINRSFLVNKAKDISTVLNYLSCIQVDPVTVIAKTHELSLYNRVENFKISDLYEEMYVKNKYFEHWFQLFSIIPIKAFPYLKHMMIAERSWHSEYYATHKNEIETVYNFIKENGETSSKEIVHLPKIRSLFSWKDKSDSGTAALSYLWDRGRILISRRNKNNRYYDLTERIVPKKILEQDIEKDEANQFVIESNFNYLGIIRTTHLTKVGYRRYPGLKEKFEQMIKSGEILSLQIDGVKTKYFILKKQVKEFNKLKKLHLHKQLNILPPLDPLVIDRRILSDIFEYDYLWELYVPALKRKFSHYGMPVLYNGEFVGQIEMKKLKSKNEKVKIKILKTQLVKDVDKKKIKRDLKSEVEKMEKLISL